MKLRLTAPAKINLFLDVLWKRADGFHNIQSIMQTVSLADTVVLNIAEAAENRITLSCTDSSIPTDSENLAFRAAELYFERFGISGKTLDIFIEKHIPIGAGLAGGSADAAAVLSGLNKLFGSKAGMLELIDTAVRIGSDVPFCLVGGTKVTQKRGEDMVSVSPLPDCSIVICSGNQRISTKWAYEELDRIYNGRFSDRADRRARIRSMIHALNTSDLAGVVTNTYNIFEDAVLPLCPEAKENRDSLLSLGADAALMSGSGSAVFGIFRSSEQAQNAKRILEAPQRRVYLCRPL
ncbi:MAG: 4-(cytidine 5'-diphospho)-2-C-methyl-D-erythritol kinase [Eubacteriales bacterium]